MLVLCNTHGDVLKCKIFVSAACMCALTASLYLYSKSSLGQHPYDQSFERTCSHDCYP